MLAVNGNVQTNTVTLPWGKGASIPPEHIVEEAEIRSTIDQVQTTATDQVETRWSTISNWGRDLDPDNRRVLQRSSVDGVDYAVAVQTEQEQTEPKDEGSQLRLPLVGPLVSYNLQSSDNSVSASAGWTNGEFSSYKDSSLDPKGNAVTHSIQVNNNGTITYTTTKVQDADVGKLA